MDTPSQYTGRQTSHVAQARKGTQSPHQSRLPPSSKTDQREAAGCGQGIVKRQKFSIFSAVSPTLLMNAHKSYKLVTLDSLGLIRRYAVCRLLFELFEKAFHCSLRYAVVNGK